MYDAIKCVLSTLMIYECNGCACKLISCLAEENKSLITGDDKIFDPIGEDKFLTTAGKNKSWIDIGDSTNFDC